ncbi:MAG TPA: M48 family metallopeptidase, partial [Longimicrobium sp.]
MLPDRHAVASELHLRRALLFAALGYAYVAGVLLALAGVIFLLARFGLGVLAGYALAGIFVYTVFALLAWFAPPEGRRVTRDECPELFRAIDRARGELRAPPVDGVFLTHDMNAAVMERPRFGVVGWNQRFLLVGLPLLHALTADEVRAILAHEFAHLSRQHSRSLRLLARAEGTWMFLELVFAASWARLLFIPFFRWYTPRLEALTQQTRRAHELESDRLAARVAGAPAMGRALLRLALWNARLERVVLPSVFRRSLEKEEPGADDFARLLDALGELPGGEGTERLVRSALRDRTLDNHSHPSLADRLEALGVDAAEAGRGLAAGRGSAAELLGTRARELAAVVGAAWAESAAPLWRRCHADARIWTEEPVVWPSPEAVWAHARW